MGVDRDMNGGAAGATGGGTGMGPGIGVGNGFARAPGGFAQWGMSPGVDGGSPTMGTPPAAPPPFGYTPDGRPGADPSMRFAATPPAWQPGMRQDPFGATSPFGQRLAAIAAGAPLEVADQLYNNAMRMMGVTPQDAAHGYGPGGPGRGGLINPGGPTEDVGGFEFFPGGIQTRQAHPLRQAPVYGGLFG